MKVRPEIFLLLAVAITGASTQSVLPQARTIHLEGRVLRLGTLEPIPNARIFLVGINPSLPDSVSASTIANSAELLLSAQANEPGRSLLEATVAGFARESGVSADLLRPTSSAEVLTDAAGAFRFDISHGRYSVNVTKEAFFAPQVAGSSARRVSKIIRVDSTEATAALDIFMVQGGVISGHVQDSSGRPVVGARVQASQRNYPGGRFTLTLNSAESTDERGNFLFGAILPGEYFLSAAADTDQLPVRDRAPGVPATAERGAAALTYYPGVAEPWAAVPLIVNDGSEVSGIDIEIQNRRTPTFKISGVALNNAPVFQGNPRADRAINTFYLVPLVAEVLDNTPLSFQNAIPVESRTNGEFEIRDVPPGRYELYPFYRSPISIQPVATRMFTSRNSVEVRDADITNLSIVVEPGATLNAEVVETTGKVRFASPGMSLGLKVLDSMPSTFVSIARQFDSSGRLTLEHIPEARYGLSLYGLPDALYVSDIRQDGRSIFDNGFLLQQQSNPIQILISRDGATVSGRMRGTPRTPAADITVVLAPPAARRQNAALFRTTTVNEDGTFTIRGVAPGAYTAMLLENRPGGEPWLNRDFMAKYEARGRAIQVTAGQVSEIQLELTRP